METPKEKYKRKSTEILDDDIFVPETPDVQIEMSNSSKRIMGLELNNAKIIEIPDKINENIEPQQNDVKMEITDVLTGSESLFDDDDDDDVIADINSEHNLKQITNEPPQPDNFPYDESERINIDEVIACLTSQISQSLVTPTLNQLSTDTLINTHFEQSQRINSLFLDVANLT